MSGVLKIPDSQICLGQICSVAAAVDAASIIAAEAGLNAGLEVPGTTAPGVPWLRAKSSR
jgi:hypothetical protein